MKNILDVKIDKIRINGIGFFVCAMAYVYISIIIFLIGWVKAIVWIPTVLVILIALYKYYKVYKKNLENVEPIYISMKMFMILCIIAFGLAWLLGWTGHASQNGDFVKHNSILQDLSNWEWPVYYKHTGQTSMLTYYIGQYMFPALIGKIFSSQYLSLLMFGIWGIIGLIISILGVFKIVKANKTSKQIVTLIAFLFFSTCLVLSQQLGKLLIENYPEMKQNWSIFNDNYKLQYSSNITLLRWVMPQCITPWIIFSVLYDNRFDIEHYVILCLPILFYSSFSFLGIVCFLAILTIVYLIKNKDIKSGLKKIFSISNISVGLTLGIILIIYFSGNILEPKPDILKLKLVKYMGKDILIYICFMISVLPYTIILFKDNRKNSLYWIATAILYILPFFYMGYYNDLVMRVSIIPLFVYSILAIELLITKKSKIIKAILIIILGIGSVTSGIEVYESIKDVSPRFVAGDLWYSLMFQANRDHKKTEAGVDERYNYFTYELDKSIFYKYLVRKQI